MFAEGFQHAFIPYITHEVLSRCAVNNRYMCSVSPELFRNAETDAVVVKRIENGQLIIRRGEKRYNVVGLEL